MAGRAADWLGAEAESQSQPTQGSIYKNEDEEIGMIKYVSAVVVVLLAGTATAGEVDDISACIKAANSFGKQGLAIEAAEWEPFLFTPNTVQWADASCEVKADGTVYQLIVNREALIVDGFYGEASKSLMADANTRIDVATAELEARINNLERLRANIQAKLSAPNADHEEISNDLSRAFDAAFGGGGVDTVNGLIASAAEREKLENLRRAQAEIQRAAAAKLKREEEHQERYKGLEFDEFDAIEMCQDATTQQLNFPETFDQAGAPRSRIYPNEGAEVQITFTAKNAFGVPERNTADCKFDREGMVGIIIR